MCGTGLTCSGGGSVPAGPVCPIPISCCGRDLRHPITGCLVSCRRSRRTPRCRSDHVVHQGGVASAGFAGGVTAALGWSGAREGVAGTWRSLVAHLTGGQGVAGSNPVVPTEKPQVSGL